MLEEQFGAPRWLRGMLEEHLGAPLWLRSVLEQLFGAPLWLKSTLEEPALASQVSAKPESSESARERSRPEQKSLYRYTRICGCASRGLDSS